MTGTNPLAVHVVNDTPGDGVKSAAAIVAGYVMLMEKYPSACARAFRRSETTVASSALSLVPANCGATMAAKEPITTTVMSISIKVKPCLDLHRLFILLRLIRWAMPPMPPLNSSNTYAEVGRMGNNPQRVCDVGH